MIRNCFHINHFYLIFTCVYTLYTIIKYCKDDGYQSRIQIAYSVTKIILHKNNVLIDTTTLIYNQKNTY